MIPVEPFRLSMEIDARGVVVAVLEGEFDTAAWQAQREAGFLSRYRLEDYDGRPVVTDFRRCRLPSGNWSEQFRGVAEVLARERRKPFRRAIVIGPEAGAELGITLFAEFQKLFHHADLETRAFLDYDAAYAWALEALPGERDERPTPSEGRAG